MDRFSIASMFETFLTLSNVDKTCDTKSVVLSQEVLGNEQSPYTFREVDC
jgi:hypothetical protein